MIDNRRRVIKYDLEMNEIERFDSIKEAVIPLIGHRLSKYNTYNSGIIRCLTGHRNIKSAYGFIWRYEWKKDKSI